MASEFTGRWVGTYFGYIGDIIVPSDFFPEVRKRYVADTACVECDQFVT